MKSDDWGTWLHDLLPGLYVSVKLTAALLAIGLPIALLLAIGLGSRNKGTRLLAMIVVEAGRGVPALVLLYLVYFGLPQLHMTLTAFVSAAIALGVSFAAYSSEVIRAGIAAVPLGQVEAAAALGLSSRVAFARVVLPQAVRIIVPPMLGWGVVYFQATSLAFAIAVPELLSRAYTLATSNFQYFTLLVLAAVLFAVVSIPLSLIAERLSARRLSSQRL